MKDHLCRTQTKGKVCDVCGADLPPFSTLQVTVNDEVYRADLRTGELRNLQIEPTFRLSETNSKRLG